MGVGTQKKTNACRALDALRIQYATKEYVVDESDLSAEKVAAQVGMPEAQVFKTLCLRSRELSILLAVVPAGGELALSRLAKAAGTKSVTPVAVRELTQLTGYVRGGVTALACRKPYPVYLDESAMGWPYIAVSGGRRGLQILIAPKDYARATGATLAALSAPR